jgi:hypothetical protein
MRILPIISLSVVFLALSFSVATVVGVNQAESYVEDNYTEIMEVLQDLKDGTSEGVDWSTVGPEAKVTISVMVEQLIYELRNSKYNPRRDEK